MFPETAKKIRVMMEDLHPFDWNIANLGSSTEDFYINRQPWIWDEVMCPLYRMGTWLVNVDKKGGLGVDQQTLAGPLPYDMVMCCSMLEHVEHPGAMLEEIRATLKPEGLLLLDVPGDYPYHEDPIDNGLRISTREEAEELLAGRFILQSFELVKSSRGSAALFLAKAVK